jgi:DNA polymerase-3 subunit delta'
MARTKPIQDSEALPEADRLEGFPHPRETARLVGQETAERTLARAFAGGRMHHAWLLAGPSGIGKATLAYRLARHVLAAPHERDAGGPGLEVAAATSAARQVGALSHPGLLVLRRPYDLRLRRFRDSIPVDEVRRLKSFLELTAGEGAWRVVIVDSADELNVNAGNALLKSLEEPPRRALFLLISSEPGGLLATIRSRCRRLDLAPLQAAGLREAAGAALEAAGLEAPASEAWPRLELLAQGSVRRALQFAAADGLELCERIDRIFDDLPKVDWPAVHALSDSLAVGGQQQRFEAFLDLLMDKLARLARMRAKGGGEGAERALADRLIAEESLAAWATLWGTMLRERSDAEMLNLDRKALVVRAFARLQAAVAGTG